MTSAPDDPSPVLFLDDGYPEARDYDDNYVVLDPRRPRGWLRLLAGARRRRPPGGRRRREARPRVTVRLEGPPAVA